MRAFDGIRVLDFTHVYAGPFATFQLAIMGAEVIKIEAPGMPDMMRFEGVDEALNEQGLGATYIFNNQGKKAMCLNLKSDEGKKIAAKLIKSADVLVENYSGGLGRYGFDPDQALKINPQLIYCDMSGYGPNNHLHGRPAFDPVIQAYSGMMSLNGDADQEYIRVGPPLIDYGTGAQTAFAIASALFQRSRSGKGQVITVNMLDAALVMMSPLVANAMHSGETEKRTGNVMLDRPGYSVYRCQDTDIMLGAFTINQQRKLFTVLALNELVEIPQQFDKLWLKANGEILRDKMLSRFAEKPADEWEIILNDADVPAARVRDLHGMLSSDQPKRAANSRQQRLPDHAMTAPIAAFCYAESGPELDPRCARHGEDTESVLSELGYNATEIDTLREKAVI